MKFLIQNNDKNVKQMRSSCCQQSNDQYQRYYYNIMNPSNKIQCDECKRDITKATKILHQDLDYCSSCFANQQSYPQQYHVVNKLDFPLFDHGWTADEELLMFEGLEKHGFGNWGEIADFISTNKTREAVQEHYHAFYLEGKDFLPSVALLSRRDEDGKLIQTTYDSPGRRIVHQPERSIEEGAVHHNRASLTVHQTIKTGSNPAEIIGYMPKRGDFQVQYDNDAQLLLAEMEFNDEQSQEEKGMKLRLIDIYNQKLNERIKRKQFVTTRKLLDLKEQVRLDRSRTKEEKQIYHIMKVFARFGTADSHQNLVQALIREKQIRQKIQELKEFKKKGFRTLAEVQMQLEAKRKKQQKNKKKDNDLSADKVTRRMRKDPGTQKSQKRVLYVNKQEQELCKTLNISFKQFMTMKETIIRQCVRCVVLDVEQATRLFKVQPQVTEQVFNFLVKQQDIIERDKELVVSI